ncbi:MAG: iron-containing alcohol dehydrogenase [Bacteroidales bacterium]
MDNFTLYNPTKLIFGKDTIPSLREEIPQDSRVLALFGGGSVKKNGVFEQVTQALSNHTCHHFWGVEPNPSVETLRNAIELGREKGCNFILAVGGGSVIDGAKLVAAAIPYSGDPWDLVLKRNYTHSETLPLGCVLTLPATGSEMNRGAVITNKATKEKFAFYSHTPKFSILDPQSCYTLSHYQKACGLADTFVHVLEQYLTTPGQSPLMDRWAEGILLTLLEIAPKVMEEGENYQEMASFMLSATMGLNGFIALGVSQDWTTHMIGHELSALHNLTHAHTLAIVLPGTLRVLREEKGDKIVQMAKRVFSIDGGDRDRVIESTIEEIEQFFISLGFKIRLSQSGVPIETIYEIERRFESRGVKLGENRAVDSTIVRKILDSVI